MPAPRGFTLVELLVALAVAVILVTVAVPGFSTLMQDNRLVTAVNRFHAAHSLARSEAIRRRRDVVICNSAAPGACAGGGGWEQGWLVFEDLDRDRDCGDPDGDLICADGGQVLRQVRTALEGGLTIRTGGSQVARRVVYTALGMSPGYLDTFRICDARGRDHARALTLTMTGRLRPVALADTGRNCP